MQKKKGKKSSAFNDASRTKKSAFEDASRTRKTASEESKNADAKKARKQKYDANESKNTDAKSARKQKYDANESKNTDAKKARKQKYDANESKNTDAKKARNQKYKETDSKNAYNKSKRDYGERKRAFSSYNDSIKDQINNLRANAKFEREEAKARAAGSGGRRGFGSRAASFAGGAASFAGGAGRFAGRTLGRTAGAALGTGSYLARRGVSLGRRGAFGAGRFAFRAGGSVAGVGALSLLGVIAAVTKVSDSNLRIVGILRGISDDTDKQLSYYKEITSISQETGANTETLADLYRKTIPVLKQEGDAKLVAEAVGLSKAVYNLSTENVKDGVTQLTQALGLGYFRAEEFTGVHENLGLLLQKVAERTLLPDGTQATVASLKLLANKGEYKNEDFLGGLRVAKDDIGGELANTPYTISRGFDQFKQRFGRQIKELEEKDGRFERSGLRIGNVLGSTGIDKLTESLYEISSRFVKFATDLLENSPKIIEFIQEKYAEYKDKTVVFLEKLNFIVDKMYHAVVQLTESLPKVQDSRRT